MPNAQVLSLTPSTELSFEGPFTEVVTTQLTLGNPTDDVVYFKVKTTAPRYYCVRPNSGIIGARGHAKISVMLQPVDQPSTLEKDRTRHKFMIQSAIASSDDTPVDEFWKTINPTEVMDSKLKVVFTNLNASENGGGADMNLTGGHNDTSNRYADTHSTQQQHQQQQPKEPPPAYKAQESAQPVQRRNVEPQRTAPSNKSEHRSGSGDRDRNALTEENFSLVQQVQELRHKLNAATRTPTVQPTSITLVQLILAVVAALLIGVIVGKLL